MLRIQNVYHKVVSSLTLTNEKDVVKAVFFDNSVVYYDLAKRVEVKKPIEEFGKEDTDMLTGGKQPEPEPKRDESFDAVISRDNIPAKESTAKLPPPDIKKGAVKKTVTKKKPK